jgi:hypothetical protein
MEDIIDLLDSSDADTLPPPVSAPIRVQPSRKSKQIQPPAATPVAAVDRSTEMTQPAREPVSLIDPWKEIESCLRCDICKQLMDVPVSLNRCSHTFCSFCIRRYLELSGNDYCPCCRVPASSTDIRLEPRICGILMVLARERGMVRKSMRYILRASGESSTPIQSANETFNRQCDLLELFKSVRTGTSVTRTPLPLYKSLKDKQLKDLVRASGLLLPNESTLSRDDLIRIHKEFVFTVQATHDGIRMGMYPDVVPSVEALAKSWNMDYARKCGTSFARKPTVADQRRDSADTTQAVTDLRTSAQKRMREQLMEAVAKRKKRGFN